MIMLAILFISALNAGAQMAMPDHVIVGATKHYNVYPNPNPLTPSSYTWKINGVIQTGFTTHEIDITWSTEGTYLLEVQEQSADGCLGPIRSGQVFVGSLPGLGAVGIDPATCGTDGSIQFTLANVPDGTYTITYDLGSFSNVVVVGGSATATASVGIYNNLTITVAGTTTVQGLNVNISAPISPTLLISGKQDISCNGYANGQITVAVPGGHPDYYYSLNGDVKWSASAYSSPFTITGLSPGNYSVTVKDAINCISAPSATTTINEPTILTTTTTGTNVSCAGANDGTATVTAEGGTSPYTYLWSNGQTTATATNLSEGKYNITVTDAKGCITQTSFMVGTTPDTTPPNFTLPAAFEECVKNLISVSYNPLTKKIDYNQPDYYTFKAADLRMDLDPANFTDNCDLMCPVEIRWKIDMNDGTRIPALPTEYQTGQPSTVNTPIELLGDGVTYNQVIHHITYWIVDCSGNVSAPQSQTITIKPRPKID